MGYPITVGIGIKLTVQRISAYHAEYKSQRGQNPEEEDRE
jgi:hypothetical protein